MEEMLLNPLQRLGIVHEELERLSSIKKMFTCNIAYQIMTIINPLITTQYISNRLGTANIGICFLAHSFDHYYLFTMLALNEYGNRTITVVRDIAERFIGVVAVFLYLVNKIIQMAVGGCDYIIMGDLY